MYEIIRERIPARDRRLGRHVHHDSRSRSFAWRPTGALPLVSTQHIRHVPVLDQGSLGSCTGNAAIGCMGTGLFYTTVSANDPYHALNEADAVALYSRATQIDPWAGSYPPDDTGSDGLSVAKVLVEAGMISGYLHPFGLAAALDALMHQPIITGTNWLNSMFDVTPEGLVIPAGGIAGGHEYVADGYDDVRGWVWFTNSWGSWGKAGSFAMEAEAWGRLLEQDGDVTAFVPAYDPAPVPDPPITPPGADLTFAQALRPWATDRHVGSNARAAKAARAWLAARGL